MNKSLAYKMLAFIGFVLEETRFAFSYKTVGQTLAHLDGTEYKITTLRKEFSLLKKDGLIELKPYYHRQVPVLTQKGKLALKTRLPFKSYGAWDQKWRLIIFDIPETERKYRLALRDKLNELGFGKVQKSAYLTPYPLVNIIDRFATKLGIRQYLRLLEIGKIDDERKLIEKTWDLENINNGYRNFIGKSRKTPRDIYWPLRAKRLEQEFVEIYEADPHLPREVLPKDWAGTRAYKTFKEISNSY